MKKYSFKFFYNLFIVTFLILGFTNCNNSTEPKNELSDVLSEKIESKHYKYQFPKEDSVDTL